MVKAWAVKAPSGELLYTTVTSQEWEAREIATNTGRAPGFTVIPVTITEGAEHPAVAVLRKLQAEIDKMRAYYADDVKMNVDYWIEDKIEELSK